MLTSLRAKPLPHQRKGIAFLEDHDGRAILADDMGLGKTLQVLWTIKRNPDWTPAVIVCPAAVKFNWEAEAIFHVGLTVSICQGRQPPKFKATDPFLHSDIIICNYDILKDWLPYLKRLKPQLMVLDECQNTGSTKSKKTKAVLALSRCVPRVIGLSGTLFYNRPAELWPALCAIWPNEFPSFFSFAQLYCAPRWTFRGWVYNGASRLDELHKRLTNLGMLRRRKSEELKDLPDKIRQVVPCRLSDYQEYKLAKADFMLWVKKTMPHKMRKLQKVEKMAKVGYLLRLCARLKIKAVVDWANSFLEQNPDEKLILFAIHDKAIDVLKRRINAKAIVINGSVTGRDRKLAIDQFQTDPSIRVCLGQLRAAGVGITLTAASTVGVVELWWNPGLHKQAEDRPYRIGQKNKVNIYYFVAIGTLEEKLCSLIQSRQKSITAIMDGGVPDDDLDLMEELTKALEKENE
jgi:SWI/SNF-related matrix-associated actin-dependent regulator 1 of chromatin subfamily A